MKKNVCKICRRLGDKIFLKGDKCSSPKCSYIRRPFPPGPKKKRRSGSFTEYAKELREKQKLRKHYGLSERQFRKYVQAILAKRGKVKDTALLLIRILETRLDNVVFRLGLAKSRKEARQLVSHSYFLVNSKTINIPSFAVKKGFVVSLKENKKQKPFFKNIAAILKNYQPPTWLNLNKEKVEGEVIGEPSLGDVGSKIDISTIFGFYAR